MKKPSPGLFILRLFFYFSVTGLLFIHPGISVSFDRIGLLQWFAIIPIEAVIAFLPPRFLNYRKKYIAALAFLLPLSVWAGGFGPGALQPFLAGLISFTLTILLFHHPRWGKLSIMEPFFLAWVCLRLLALSRSGEDIAGQSASLTQFILVWTGVVFFLHSAVIYFCLYPKSLYGAWKEGALFFFASLAVLFLALVALPPDFVRNAVIGNMLSQRAPEMLKPGGEYGTPRNHGGRRTRFRPEDGQSRLRGLSENEWRIRSGRGDSADDQRQYMVMVVASKYEPVYMARSFRGQLDPLEGFLTSFDEPLNNVAKQRFFVTWYDNEWDNDHDRKPQEVFSLSSLPEKYLPYRPLSIDPTIQNENSGPLRFIHQVISNVHSGDPLMLVHRPSRPFSNFERRSLSQYFEINLEESDRELFSAYLDRALERWDNNREIIIRNNDYLSYIFSGQSKNNTDNEHMEKILAIMTSFSKYQYNLTHSNDHSIDVLKEFLFDSNEGDCVEFSNTLALLGRLAGIPSRVVTGFFAAEELQTPAHLQGLFSLQKQIPFLQRFKFEELFMVTNLHAHSWAQFYIPDYGWLDFEGTAFSIPPFGMGDFNNWDLVIPIIDEGNRVFSPVRKFPWRIVLRAAGFLAVFALLGAYILRYGRELVLYLGTRRGGRAGVRSGARSLYLLLLARLAADGKPIKPASRTALEYAELFSGAEKNSPFAAFAAIYTELRWREFTDGAERDKKFIMLKHEYRNILETNKRRGVLGCVIRIFSLRGLAYL